MNTAYRFIHRHTRNTLIARGWPAEMDIQTRLSYSQGDGVAFYGSLTSAQLVHLLPEIALRGLMDDRNMRELVGEIAGSSLSVRLYPNSLSRQYAHSGTISLEYSDSPDGLSERHAVMLLTALRAEINHVCGCVAAAGYRVLESFSPSENPLLVCRKTRNFSVRIVEVEPEDDADSWDNEAVDRLLLAILDGNVTYRTLRIEIEAHGLMLAQNTVRYAWRKDELPVRRWFDRSWLRIAVCEAREEVQVLLGALSSLRPDI
ncbi:hypothetical protein [Enterobacter cancerogenus]|uniref:hypothetical protein n=1 Tax=Enterobacter cancerogenus TaxID=69218 RepID=UPI0028B3B3EC|nr:hypothetical protein [Enterobacter cancerogenus]MDT7012780.1 hypothetical protein [Enterobacter cancerogenus]WNN59222.1 hypothetical protein RIN64_22905 [Enterobacter cancerogenus]